MASSSSLMLSVNLLARFLTIEITGISVSLAPRKEKWEFVSASVLWELLGLFSLRYKRVAANAHAQSLDS